MVLGIAGCDGSPDLAVLQVCDAVCTCDSPDPLRQSACMDECQAQLPPTLSDECVECATESACLAIDDCFDLCFPGVP